MFSNINRNVRTTRSYDCYRGQPILICLKQKNHKGVLFAKSNDLYQLAHILFKNNFSFLLIFFLPLKRTTYHLDLTITVFYFTALNRPVVKHPLIDKY